MKDCRGLTLVELVVVLAIIGVLLTVIPVNTKTPSDESALEAAVYRIVQDIRLTQQLALTSGTPYYFEIHIKENYYRIWSHSTGTYKLEYLDPGISISVTGLDDYYAGSHQYLRGIRYTSAGTPSKVGTITLNKNGRKRNIAVMVGTGRVRIY